jgi:hypothetical protein
MDLPAALHVLTTSVNGVLTRILVSPNIQPAGCLPLLENFINGVLVVSTSSLRSRISAALCSLLAFTDSVLPTLNFSYGLLWWLPGICAMSRSILPCRPKHSFCKFERGSGRGSNPASPHRCCPAGRLYFSCTSSSDIHVFVFIYCLNFLYIYLPAVLFSSVVRSLES